ncbi:carbonic anhydrase [Massilia sp. erpn]|uniref:carbonic anhydrase n=1 Tax=Massilia sp. erpn TaxID=2738142 RepID=UPI002103FB70|nr:carbonic anhydrase family protein [Massilia sp. erpn]UTY59588.1 carbonic anhydrase family protein [Massilia sp. erpn]
MKPLSIAAAMLCGAVLLPSQAFAADKEQGHSWTYEGKHGPKHWSELNDDYKTCKLGHHQSPIDIRKTSKAELPKIEFDYKPATPRILDNGHTVQVNFGAGSGITLDGKRYELLQFHFHNPSEESINGKRYGMVAHLVHKSADNKLAVVAVLFKNGKENPLIKTLWSQVPSEKNKEVELSGGDFDLNSLLPAQQGYYNFAGSLTTPPCSEEVNWLVLKQPVEMSSQQFSQFSKIYPHNARPVQALNGRVVKESM